MKRKILVVTALACLFLLAPMILTASAAQPKQTTVASGVGVFVHDHEGISHNHYFVFGISSASKSPQGHFSLVCKHGDQIETIIFSTQINSFSVTPVQGGLRADFSGSALVKMGVADFTSGWTFEVVAFDFGKGSDSIGVTLIDSQGQVHCMAEPTQLASGNINIKANL
ncbi:MAG: hypothetical protein ACM3UL_02305 [Ignavibacteria bacterium]